LREGERERERERERRERESARELHNGEGAGCLEREGGMKGRREGGSDGGVRERCEGYLRTKACAGI